MSKKLNSHYTKLEIEPWQIMQADFTKEEYIGFLKGNILKYLLRNKELPADYQKLQAYSLELVRATQEKN